MIIAPGSDQRSVLTQETVSSQRTKFSEGGEGIHHVREMLSWNLYDMIQQFKETIHDFINQDRISEFIVFRYRS